MDLSDLSLLLLILSAISFVIGRIVAWRKRAVERYVRTPLSDKARAARMPPPPESLVGALQDRINTAPERTRIAKARKEIKASTECNECPDGNCEDCPRKPARWYPQRPV